jgi:hypothetical protein
MPDQIRIQITHLRWTNSVAKVYMITAVPHL